MSVLKRQGCNLANVSHRQHLFVALQRVEWVRMWQGPFAEPGQETRLICPVCQRTKEAGHLPDCVVGKALGRKECIQCVE